MPSDLEQMPYLSSFASGNRMLLTHDHSQLISHTANACIRSMTLSIRGAFALRRYVSRGHPGLCGDDVGGRRNRRPVPTGLNTVALVKIIMACRGWRTRRRRWGQAGPGEGA